MKAPAFWSAAHPGWLGRLLAPLGFLYGRATLRRMARPGWRAPVPVISVGNFTAGGAGKTPVAIALARDLLARGETPAFVTRGYGGRIAGPHRVRDDDAAAGTGDEPLLLARTAPAYVARDRAAGARLAIAEGASVIILDDALQNPALVKDLSLAVVDGPSGLGNGAVMPAGPLRAPLAAQLAQVDLVLILGEDRQEIAGRLGTTPLACGRIVPEPPEGIAGARVLAFSGIALPAKFEASLAEAGAEIVARRRFGDHHPFSEAEAAALLDEATRLGLTPVTTEKDRVRLAGGPAREALRRAALVLPIRLEAGADFFEPVYRAVSRARSR